MRCILRIDNSPRAGRLGQRPGNSTWPVPAADPRALDRRPEPRRDQGAALLRLDDATLDELVERTTVKRIIRCRRRGLSSLCGGLVTLSDFSTTASTTHRRCGLPTSESPSESQATPQPISSRSRHHPVKRRTSTSSNKASPKCVVRSGTFRSTSR